MTSAPRTATVPPTSTPVSTPTSAPARSARPGARDDLGWSLVTLLLGPVADRHPDVALSLLGCADEAVAAGRARWRRHGPWPARP